MNLLVSRRILKREFGRAISSDDLSVLRRTAKVALATSLAGSGLPAGTRLLKAYGTARSGPKRVIYLLVVKEGDLFLLFYRGKNDPLGANATAKNPAFRVELHKYLALLEQDIRAGELDTIDLLAEDP
ncbi:MAG: hypothetical protein D4R65_05635 [Verrucomicrobiaceae bacterium]|nr:MAG: hypothetical protein D4R65_05635 [Verrucomicrobiaceae bacterium]